MNFTDAGANARSRFDLRQFGIDEDAGHDAGVGQAGDDIVQPGFLDQDIETAFGGDFVTAFRHQHGHFRLQLTGDADHFVGRRHFQIQFGLGQITQAPDVGILNVTAIFPQMNGNAVRTAEMGFDGAPDGVRFIGAARLAQRGDVVDVNAKFDHISCNSLNILRVSSSLPPR